MKSYAGEIKARIIECRFALSGKVARVNKVKGDTVKKWDLLGSLDRKILQTELDQQLADFEKVNADFTGFAKKFPDPQDDNKFTKAEKQAGLNASVKQVELAKARLDQVDIFSPVDGIVLDDGEIAAGIYTTPGGSPFTILDTSSYYFEFEITQKEVFDFREANPPSPKASEGRKCKIKVEGVKEEIEGETSPVFSDGKKFSVKIPITNTKDIMLGMTGQARM